MGKSILEQTNSWKPFVDAIQGALRAKDFRKSTISSILHIVDPELSMWPGSMKRYLFGLLIGPGFVSGREALFNQPFEQFLSQNKALFENAPLKVIELFNTLSNTLFSPRTAPKIDESLARRPMSREEKMLKKGKEAQKRLSGWMKQVQEKEPVHTITETPEETAPTVRPLFSSYSPLDEETQHILEKLTEPVELTFDHTSKEAFEKPVRAIEEGVQAGTTRIQQLITQLILPPLNKFKELAQESEGLSRFSFEKEFLASLLEKDPKAIQQELASFFSKKEKKLSEILEKAKSYDQDATHIEEEKEKLIAQLSPFLKKKDLKGKAEILLSELSLLSMPSGLFAEKTAIIEQTLEEKKQLLQGLQEKTKEQFHGLLVEVRELERSADFYKMFLFAARWEIIAESVPYPDLKKSISNAREALLTRIEQQRTALVAGSISLDEHMEKISSSLYESDIRLIRGELTSRSLRLKELREAVGCELAEIDRYIYLTHLSKSSDIHLSTERKWLFNLYYKLLNPFSLFKETYNPDTVHLLFRYFWHDLDRYRARKKDLYERFSQTVDISSIISPIAQTLDLVKTKKTDLYERFLDCTKDLSLEKLLNFLRVHSPPFLLPLASLSFSEQRKEQSHIAKLEQRIEAITSFAKEIQRIRTFEPERLDSLLEITSVFPFIEKLDSKRALSDHLQKIEIALYRLEQEVCSELGLLDKKARLEGGSALETILEQAQGSISSLLQRLNDQLNKTKKASDIFLRPVAEAFIKRISFLDQLSEKSSSDHNAFFSYLHKVAVLLFSTKALSASLNPNSFARILLIIPITQNIIQNMSGVLHDEHLFALETISRNMCNEISIDLDRQRLKRTLLSFIQTQESSQAFITARLTKSLEERLIKSLQEVVKLLDSASLFEIPRLSFIPGDLWYLWH